MATPGTEPTPAPAPAGSGATPQATLLTAGGILIAYGTAQLTVAGASETGVILGLIGIVLGGVLFGVRQILHG